MKIQNIKLLFIIIVLIAQMLTFTTCANMPKFEASSKEATTEEKTLKKEEQHAKKNSSPIIAKVESTGLIKEIQLELNKVRTNPSKYASEILEPRLSQFDGDLYTPLMLRTHEGISAVKDCINYMKKIAPRPPLVLEKGLCSSAQLLANYQAANNKIGHIGSGGSTYEERISAYGVWDISIAENCGYGFSDAREIVVQLLIDDGVASRGHRKNIFNPSVKKVGIGYKFSNSHRYKHVTVMDFAATYNSK